MNSTCQITNTYRDMKSPTASKLEELECQTNDEDLDCLIGAPSSRPFPSRGNARGDNHHNGNELVPMVSGDSSTGSKGKEMDFFSPSNLDRASPSAIKSLASLFEER